MVIDFGNGHGNSSSILDETVCISRCVNILEKDMNPIIFPSAMDEQADNLGMETGLREFNPVKLR